MQRVVLDSSVDFDGWRKAARTLLAAGVEPSVVEWSVAGETRGLFGDDGGVITAAESGQGAAAARASKDAVSVRQTDIRVPSAFVRLAQTAILHSDPGRFALFYSLLKRVSEQRNLLKVAVDPDVARAEQMAKSVRHDMHKMTAFVRFREILDAAGEPVYVAWFEPTHHIVEATAPFFARRFTNRRWSILTPERSVHWDGKSLQFAPGAARTDAPDDDKLEDLWRTYYANIFNPARLKIDMMQKEMPQKYWRNLPEAELIAPLIASARHRTQSMIDEAPTEPPKRRMEVIASGFAPPVSLPATLDTLDNIRAAAKQCRQCPLWEPATQTVFGEGDAHARVMLIGEQAGDQEDLVGRPFVGPAGQLLNRALAQAGIDREKLYVTNAVKHFKFVSKGKRRIHQRPVDAEIDACYPWLDRELQQVQPSLVVAMGATATRALTGKTMGIEANRGRIIELSDGSAMMITVHPSYLLRISDDAQPREFARFVADLERARPYLERIMRPPESTQSEEERTGAHPAITPSTHPPATLDR